MYSLLLMAALSGNATVPTTFHGCHGCHGCYSCGCGCYGCGCYGCGCWGCGGCGCYGCGGCSCYGCYGCFGCGGCSSYCGCGCYSYGCCGCYSYGCCGGYSYGCCGCYSSCCGYSYGCCGGYGCCGCYGAVVTPAAPAAAPAATPLPAPAAAPRADAGRARVIVQVPAEAKLYVDDYLTKTEGQAERSFTTPSLDAGREYYYILKAEIVRNGETLTETRRLVVRAGQEARASFGDMANATPATKTVTQK